MLKVFAAAALVAAIFVSAPARADVGWGRGHERAYGRDYGHGWKAPQHVYGYRGPILHPRHYRRPACLRSWLRWEETGSEYWRLRYLACVL